jgi:hypothetical protein
MEGNMDEAMRHRIHGRLEAQLGSEEAAAVMTPLTQATTIDDRFDRLEDKIDRLAVEMNQLYRWTIGSIFAAISLGLAAGQLIH